MKFPKSFVLGCMAGIVLTLAGVGLYSHHLARERSEAIEQQIKRQEAEMEQIQRRLKHQNAEPERLIRDH